MRQEVKAYIVKLCCSFLQHMNISKTYGDWTSHYCCQCKDFVVLHERGSNAHGKYVKDPITASIHSTISRTKFNVPKETSRRALKIDVKK